MRGANADTEFLDSLDDEYSDFADTYIADLANATVLSFTSQLSIGVYGATSELPYADQVGLLLQVISEWTCRRAL